MTDRITERLGLRWGRAAPIAASRLVVGGAYFACLAAHDPLIFTALMCVVACATDIGTAPTWAWSQDVGGKHVGAVVGWSNMWGNVGAAIAPLAFQRLLTRHPDHPTAAWQSAFLFCGIIQVVAMIAALGIDARHPIVPRDSEPSQ